MPKQSQGGRVLDVIHINERRPRAGGKERPRVPPFARIVTCPHPTVTVRRSNFLLSKSPVINTALAETKNRSQIFGTVPHVQKELGMHWLDVTHRPLARDRRRHRKTAPSFPRGKAVARVSEPKIELVYGLRTHSLFPPCLSGDKSATTKKEFTSSSADWSATRRDSGGTKGAFQPRCAARGRQNKS
jgi:hypothetical protein